MEAIAGRTMQYPNQYPKRPIVRVCRWATMVVLLLAFFLSGFANESFDVHDRLPGSGTIGTGTTIGSGTTIGIASAHTNALSITDLLLEEESDEDLDPDFVSVRTSSLCAFFLTQTQDAYFALQDSRVTPPLHALGARAPPTA